MAREKTKNEETPQKQPKAREYVALSYALGVARGMLHSVIQGDHDMHTVRQILDGTSLSNIAFAIGETEAELAPVEWDDLLTDQEKLTIKGWYLSNSA